MKNETVVLDAELTEYKVARTLIEHYRPEFVAEGGNHIVYRIPKHPNVVVKVHRTSFEQVQAYLQEHGLTTPDAYLRSEAKKRIDSVREERTELARFFPRTSVLREQIFFAQIPVPSPRQPDGDRPVSDQLGWGLVRVQRAIPRTAVLPQSLDSPYPERRLPKLQNETHYWKATDALLKGAPCATEDIYWIQRNIKSHIDRAEQDTQYRIVLEDFVRRLILYTNSTNRILDLVGKDNVVFLQTLDKNWRYLLVDVLYEARLTTKHVLKASQQIIAGATCTDLERSILTNGLQAVRIVNGLATALEMPDRVCALAPLAALPYQARHHLYGQLHTT